jgi:hypothetical protein
MTSVRDFERTKDENPLQSSETLNEYIFGLRFPKKRL